MKKIFCFSCLFLFVLAITLQAEVLTVGLSSGYHYNGKPSEQLREIDEYYSRLRGEGIDIVWDASPANWISDVFSSAPRLQYYNDFADIIRSHGIGVGLGFSTVVFFPAKGLDQYKASVLDPKTGLRIRKKKWDLGNREAMKELENRLDRFMRCQKPRELFYVDEQILIVPGPDAHLKRMSAYWTSPTYSDACLKSFRDYLKKRNFPSAETCRFPVTTQSKPSSEAMNQGVPAIPITQETAAYLMADDNWPHSPLWKAWYDWREDLLTASYALQLRKAVEILSDNPHWRGTMISAPDFWFCPETGLNPHKLARIPELNYLVAGYMGSHDPLKLKPAADANGKKLGGMVELSVYGRSTFIPGETIVSAFKRQVRSGAELMLFYPLGNFNPKRTLPKQKKVGMEYRPSQVNAWRRCVQFLREEKLTAKPVFSKPQRVQR